MLPNSQLNEALLRAIASGGQFGSMLGGAPMVLPSNPAPVVQASPFAERGQSAQGQQAAPAAGTMAGDGAPLMPPPPPPQRQFFSNVISNVNTNQKNSQLLLLLLRQPPKPAWMCRPR